MAYDLTILYVKSPPVIKNNHSQGLQNKRPHNACHNVHSTSLNTEVKLPVKVKLEFQRIRDHSYLCTLSL
jgi:hypothetical protein